MKSAQWAPRGARAAVATVVALCGAVAGQALAQEAADADLPASGRPSPRELGVSSELAPSGVLADPGAVELSPAERVQSGKGFVDAIERSAQSIQRQLQSARKDRDVVRVLCLNDKLNQVDVALRSARDRLSALSAAVERSDADRSRHEYTVLEVLDDRVRTLVNESSQCIGEEAGFIDDAEVSVSIDPNLPDNDSGFELDSYALPPPPNISSPIE